MFNLYPLLSRAFCKDMLDSSVDMKLVEQFPFHRDDTFCIDRNCTWGSIEEVINTEPFHDGLVTVTETYHMLLSENMGTNSMTVNWKK
jgi:hypothetical protein